MRITRSEFFQLITGGSAWLLTSGFARQIRPVVPDVARPLPLTAVRLTGGPLKKAQDLNAAYLLSLEPDRMLAFYRTRAGLDAEGAGLHRLGRRRPPAHGPHRRPPSLGREPDVGRVGRSALQAACRLHRLRAEGGAGRARRRLRRRAARCARSVRGRLERQHQGRKLRSERPLVAVVHAAQDVCGPARRLSLHG